MEPQGSEEHQLKNTVVDIYNENFSQIKIWLHFNSLQIKYNFMKNVTNI